MSDAQESGLSIFTDENENEAPLTSNEEDKLKTLQEDRAIKKLTDLRARVLSVKAAIEEENFIEIFIKPIRGNISEIKEALENVDKPRDLAMMQGRLIAYRKMLNFPETACGQLETEVSEIKRDMPLFYMHNETFQDCQKIRFDKDQYKIITE